jgi:hypothetical protein
VGKETKFITKILKKFNIKIAFTTDNTIEKLLTKKQKQERNKYDKSGIYQLTCPTCDKKYIGQTMAHLKPDSRNIYGTSNTTIENPNLPNIC